MELVQLSQEIDGRTLNIVIFIKYDLTWLDTTEILFEVKNQRNVNIS